MSSSPTSIVEDKKEKIENARIRLTELAATKMYADLLTGEYNKNYELRISSLDNSVEGPKKFPPHILDHVLDGRACFDETSFDRINLKLNKSKIHERAEYERSLYNLCILKKHAFVQKYKKLSTFKKEKKQSRDIILKAYKSHFYNVLFFMLTTSVAFGFLSKLHKNGLKLFCLAPVLSYFGTVIYTRYKFTSVAFDSLTSTLPDDEMESERQKIINDCLIGDYNLAMRAMTEEIDLCKAPTDYIYSTLI